MALEGNDMRFRLTSLSSATEDEVGFCLGVLCARGLALALADFVAAM